MTHPPQRHTPWFSRASVILTIFVLSIVAFALWVEGGTIFSPGPVSAKGAPGVELHNFSTHADFETQCRYCHLPLQGDQAGQCLDCHRDIDSQLARRQGLHGQLDRPRACAACHAEHKGRQFDPSQAALASFDHARTSFPLTGEHGTLPCQRCHLAPASRGAVPAPQNSALDYTALRPQCEACHAEPAAHAGLFGADCAACHTTFAWQPAAYQGKAFDHRTAGFTLDRHAVDFNGAALVCTACHTGRPAGFDPQPCQACHAARDADFTTTHVDQYGSACLDCHDGVDRLHGFDHQVAFPLAGQHAKLACAGCHQDGHYRGASPACASCHAEPAIHAGYFGARCDYCHTDQGWRPAPLHAHTFPLDHGGGGEVACQTCHPASYAAYRCDACHEHAADGMAQQHASLKLSAAELAGCVKCHLSGKK